MDYCTPPRRILADCIGENYIDFEMIFGNFSILLE